MAAQPSAVQDLPAQGNLFSKQLESHMRNPYPFMQENIFVVNFQEKWKLLVRKEWFV